jgi:hypothetical protein
MAPVMLPTNWGRLGSPPPCSVGREVCFGPDGDDEPCEHMSVGHVEGIAGEHEGTGFDLCAEHMTEFMERAERGGAEVEMATTTGNRFQPEPVTDDGEVFILRDPTMAVPELMRCKKCHEFMVEGSRCTFIGPSYHRRLVHASCVGK